MDYREFYQSENPNTFFGIDIDIGLITTLMIIAAIITVALVVTIVMLCIIIPSPFRYPYMIIDCDVSGKRNVKIGNEIDKYFIRNGFKPIDAHNTKTKQWMEKQEEYLTRCQFKKRRTRQYQSALDPAHAYVFNISRAQTRYKQAAYVRTSYKVQQVHETFRCDYNWLLARYRKLEEINFECTLEQYHCKNQRKLLTPRLRQIIKERDNYTCQLCGKYMPDEVGLHIDHIIPVSKDGKTVESNLQVLCSKCNSKKAAKMPEE